MAVICYGCLKRKDLNIPSVRTGSGPCNFCGDPGRLHPKTGEPLKISNFTYPDNLIPGTQEYEKLQGDGAGGGGSTGGGFRPATRG